jgi:hypothetical protein
MAATSKDGGKHAITSINIVQMLLAQPTTPLKIQRSAKDEILTEDR